MRYTPVELRHLTLPRGFRGYKRSAIDRLVEDIADSFEEVWGERGELADRLEDLEKTLNDVKQREALLGATLVAAERAAGEAIEAAKREAELIVAEAHQEARSITRAAQSERERLFSDVRRVETLLRAALGMVEESQVERTGPDGEPLTTWPNREDTREFEAVSMPASPPEAEGAPQLPPVEEESAPEGDEDRPWANRDVAWG